MQEKTRTILHSSNKDDWGTPGWLFEELHKQYKFTLDLCARKDNALLPWYCSDIGLGMMQDKDGNMKEMIWQEEIFFCNPPYGRQWPEILHKIPPKAKGIFLLPSRTGTLWFHHMLENATWVFFFQGRLQFAQAKYPAPFDSVLFGYGLCADSLGKTGLKGYLICQEHGQRR